MRGVWVKEAMPKSYAELGATLRAARLKKGWRQSDVAERSCGRLRQDYISRIESGDHRPEFDKLEAFAETLDLDLNELKIQAGYPTVPVKADMRSGISAGSRVNVVVEPTIPTSAATPGMGMATWPPPDAPVERWVQFWLNYPGDPPEAASKAIAAARKRRKEQRDADRRMDRDRGR